MTFSVHGLAVSRGIAIGRAVIVASSRVDVAHYLVAPDEVEGEIERLRRARTRQAGGLPQAGGICPCRRESARPG